MYNSTSRILYFIQVFIKYHRCTNSKPIKIRDVGGQFIDGQHMIGSYKSIFQDESHIIYKGGDMVEGLNVDILLESPYDWGRVIEENSFDFVISGQMFEHVEFPWLTMYRNKSCIKV